MNRALIINGPNLNKLGIREKGQYGKLSLEELNEKIMLHAKSRNLKLDFFQSNHEGEIIDKLHESYESVDFIIINAAAYTHYSYAIRDAIKAINSYVIEVHITNVYQREEFRHKSVISDVCSGTITGFGYNSYLLAVDAGLFYLEDGKGECAL